MSKVKVGDKLLCKKNLLWTSSNVFIKGKYYTISEETQSYEDYIFMLIDEENERFGFDSRRGDKDRGLFVYFYTKVELRKLKLEKINEKE